MTETEIKVAIAEAKARGWKLVFSYDNPPNAQPECWIHPDEETIWEPSDEAFLRTLNLWREEKKI